MKITLPINDPNMVTVSSIEELKAEINKDEIHAALLPDVADVPKEYLDVLSALAVSGCHFGYGIRYDSFKHNYVYYIAKKDVSIEHWRSNLMTFVHKFTLCDWSFAEDFSSWLEAELMANLDLLGENMSAFAQICTNRMNIEIQGFGDHWHMDSNAVVGCKNYIGNGTLFAPRRCLKPQGYLKINAYVEDESHLFQIRDSVGISLHKGDRNGYAGVAAMHKSPLLATSEETRIVCIFGLNHVRDDRDFF